MPFFIDFSTKIEIFPHFSSISGIFPYVAVVSDNDGSAFITKAEFDSLKNNFQAQIDNYNQSIDSKIDGAIAAYLAGIKIGQDAPFEFEWVAEFPTTLLGIVETMYCDIITCKVGVYGNSSELKPGIGTLVFDENQISTSPINCRFAWFCNSTMGTMSSSGWRSSARVTEDKMRFVKNSPSDGKFIVPSFCSTMATGRTLALAYPISASSYYNWVCSGFDSSDYRLERRIESGIYCRSEPYDAGDLVSKEIHAILWENISGLPVVIHVSNDLASDNPILMPILRCVEGNGRIKINYYADTEPQPGAFLTRAEAASYAWPVLLHPDATSCFAVINKYSGSISYVDSSETDVLLQTYTVATMKSHEVDVVNGDYLVLLMKPRKENVNTNIRNANETVRLLFSANKL